ncbi:MAG: Anaerobic nitric oxide reductase transcription regulator NorR [Myxococcota bacterium]|nr:Anaerobic nitric oxide reductase transcription regulator NorR [Myxococcota bacterium]
MKTNPPILVRDKESLTIRHTAPIRMQRENPGGSHVFFQHLGDQSLRRLRQGGALSIGAAQDNDWVLGDSSVSARHCQIFQRGDKWFVKDLRSTNGTQINDVYVLETILPHQGVLRVGRCDIRFVTVPPLGSDGLSPRGLHGFTTCDARLQAMLKEIELVASSSATVLIQGETGTGKEVLARAIHTEGDKRKPFVALNCGSCPDTLIESELFGHVRGAFTGAELQRRGAFQRANGGTLFLDEVGELTPHAQTSLLRALESGEVHPVGSDDSIHVQVRVIAATHRNLQARVRDGGFREDLYYRLSVIPVELPPLRERPADILHLARRFAEQFSRESRPVLITPGVESALLAHSWRGNVRELRNVMQRACVTCHDGFLTAGDLRLQTGNFPAGAEDAAPVMTLAEMEFAAITRALRSHEGNLAEAAKTLGVNRTTLYRKMENFRRRGMTAAA